MATLNKIDCIKFNSPTPIEEAFTGKKKKKAMIEWSTNCFISSPDHLWERDYEQL